MENPKPCPFCGRELKYVEWEIKAGEHRGGLMRFYKHERKKCILDTMEVMIPDIPAWNRRAADVPV